MSDFKQNFHIDSGKQFAGLCLGLLSVFLTGNNVSAQEDNSVEQQLRRLIPAATAMDTKLFERMATSTSAPKPSEYDDHSLTFALFATDYKTAQESEGQFRWLTEKSPKPNRLAKEMYRSIGGGRFRIVTHPVTMIQQNRITKFDVKVEGQSASGAFEFHVPDLYEGKTDFAAERTGDKWRITRLRMPGLKIDLKSDESGQWWRTADLKGFPPPECLVGHTGTVWSLNFSKDGNRLVSGGSDRSIRIWDVAQRKDVLTIPGAHAVNPAAPVAGGVLSACFSPDETRIASAGDDGRAKIWNAQSGQVEFEILVENNVSQVFYALDGKSLVTASGELQVWDINSGESIRIDAHSFPTIALSPDGKTLVSAGEGSDIKTTAESQHSLKLLKIPAGQEISASTEYHEILITDVKFIPDGKRIGSCGRDKTIRIWDAGDLDQMVQIKTDQEGLQSLSWSPDGRWIVAGDLDGQVNVWNPATGKLNQELPRHPAPAGIRCVAFTPDGTKIATAGHDGVIRFWDFAPQSIEE